MNSEGTPLTKTELLEARERLQPHIHRTPIHTSRTLNAMSGANLFFKCENFQKVGAFKARGALNTLLQLSPEQKERGVTTHSSGNHGQAVAWSAQLLNVSAQIVVPENAPKVKVAAIQGYGAKVVMCPPNLDAREQYMQDIATNTGATPIHPYNHLPVIAGQSTAAQEVFEDTPPLDYLICPVGGGGLLSGSLLAAHYFSPTTKVIAGEPAGADDAYRSWKGGTLQRQVNPQTIADGLRTSLGEKAFEIMKEHLHDIVLVTEEEIIEALRLVWERMKLVVEPSCVVPLAVVLKQKERFAGCNVGLVLTGGNVDLSEICTWLGSS